MQPGEGVAPAYEQVRQYILEKSVNLIESQSKINHLLGLGKVDRFEIKKFNSEVVSLYMFLRPKLHKEGGEWNNITDAMDYYLVNPSAFTHEDAVIVASELLKFCELSDVTSIKPEKGERMKDEAY